MKSKKGFTLIEILVVIGLISIILIITIPSIIAIRKSIKLRELEAKKEALISAAEVYAQNNQSLFPKESGIIEIPVRTLVYYGYVDSEEIENNCSETIGCVMNPVNDTSMNNEIITIKRAKSVTQATWGEVGVYKVTFYANGATSVGKSSTQISIGCDTFIEDACRIKVPQIERTGFDILGFNTNANGTSGTITPGNEIVLNSSNNGASYYAITKKDIEVTFNANGGSLVSGSNSISNCTIYNTNDTCAITTIPNAERTGYTKKDGWYDARSNGNVVSLNSVSSTQTVYADWQENPSCTLTASASGVSISTSNADSYGMSISNSAIYNSKSSLPLSANTFYGFVKTDSNIVAYCALTITNANANDTIPNNVDCDSSAKKDNPSAYCATGYTYTGNNCESYRYCNNLSHGPSGGTCSYAATADGYNTATIGCGSSCSDGYTEDTSHCEKTCTCTHGTYNKNWGVCTYTGTTLYSGSCTCGPCAGTGFYSGAYTANFTDVTSSFCGSASTPNGLCGSRGACGTGGQYISANGKYSCNGTIQTSSGCTEAPSSCSWTSSSYKYCSKQKYACNNGGTSPNYTGTCSYTAYTGYRGTIYCSQTTYYCDTGTLITGTTFCESS